MHSFHSDDDDDTDGVKSNLDINPIFLICGPLVILTFNTLWFIENICNVVPLHNP